MEVTGHNTNGPGDAKKRYQETRFDTIRSNRDRVNEAREALEELSEQRAEVLREVREQMAADQATRTTSSGEDATAEPAGSKPSGDAIELSPVARAQIEQTDPARDERIKELKAAYSEGRLLTQERLDRTAEAMLSGSSDAE